MTISSHCAIGVSHLKPIYIRTRLHVVTSWLGDSDILLLLIIANFLIAFFHLFTVALDLCVNCFTFYVQVPLFPRRVWSQTV